RRRRCVGRGLEEHRAHDQRGRHWRPHCAPVAPRTRRNGARMKRLPTFKEHALRDDAFAEGHALCPGCTEAIAFHGVGRATDNGKKTIMTMGTFCGEVSTLMYPDVIAWGRGEHSPDGIEKSVGIIHNVFESAPTVAEGARDVAAALAAAGAWRG